MLGPATHWPKILAIFVAGIAIRNAFSAWLLTFPAHGPSITCSWRDMAVSVVLLIMSVMLVRRFDWARRILLVGVIVIAVPLLVRHGVGSVIAASIGDVPPEHVPTWQLWTRLEHLSSFFLVLNLGAFGVLLLCHPDVVGSFRRRFRSVEKT